MVSYDLLFLSRVRPSRLTGGIVFVTSFVWGAVVQLVEYRTRNREIAGSTHTRSTASNLEQVANLLCAQATQPPTLSGMGNE